MTYRFPSQSPANFPGRSPDAPGGALNPGHSPEMHELWATHRRWVAAILLAHMPREADLEDLLQEVAIRLVRGAADLKDPASVRPWLRTVAINLARTAGRKKKIRQRLMPDYAAQARAVSEESANTEDPRSGHEVMEDGQLAMSLARALPEEYREPLLLRAVRGLSYRQIADILSLPITTVETRLTRARRMLRDEIEKARQPRGAGARAENTPGERKP
ncbi:MAG: RNA polymerase sigma factor [Phycisphaerales bacterium]